MKFILEKAENHYTQNLPFVLFCKPNSENVVGFFQKNDSLFETNDYSEKGFIFASFNGTDNILFPEEHCEIINESFQKKATKTINLKVYPQDQAVKNEFENLVNKGINAIKKDKFKKVVLSRKETFKVENFEIFKAFEDLVHLYSSTFVYCYYHPKIGTWLGATPEQLVKVDNGNFKTIALAGTQIDQGSANVTWKKKEQEEQQFVTDYIVEKLKNISSLVKVSAPYSIQAGSVWHIRTDISGVIKLDFGLKKIIQLLHPTPAVCGLPQLEAKLFIAENETYSRSFYTGFIGELNIDNKTDLFVNLRCMELANDYVNLFIGCGITKDSIPEKEWEESVNKSSTMKRILN